jgi:hypothetical protein
VNKKEAKKTFGIFDHAGFNACGRRLIKVFCFFFSKKKFLLSHFQRPHFLLEAAPKIPIILSAPDAFSGSAASAYGASLMVVPQNFDLAFLSGGFS